MRNHYLDNLRSILILLLIPYHTAMAWNVWGEPNYIYFEGNAIISSVVVFFSPFLMPSVFLIAGICSKYSLEKRGREQYLIERVKRLLVPLVFGTLIIMPVMTYLADRFNCSYEGSYFEHYSVFFGKFTDLTGADGGFSFGQFWFLLYLMVISLIAVALVSSTKKETKLPDIPLSVLIALGFPLPILSELLSIGGKSILEYTYIFVIGYYIFTEEKVIEKLEKNRFILLIIGVVASVLDVWLFLFSENSIMFFNSAAKYISEWFMVLSLLGWAKRKMNREGRLSTYFGPKSILFFGSHFVWVVVCQYLLYWKIGNRTLLLFLGTIIISYILTFVSCEIISRIPPLCFLMGGRMPVKEKATNDQNTDIAMSKDEGAKQHFDTVMKEIFKEKITLVSEYGPVQMCVFGLTYLYPELQYKILVECERGIFTICVENSEGKRFYPQMIYQEADYYHCCDNEEHVMEAVTSIYRAIETDEIVFK